MDYGWRTEIYLQYIVEYDYTAAWEASFGRWTQHGHPPKLLITCTHRQLTLLLIKLYRTPLLLLGSDTLSGATDTYKLVVLLANTEHLGSHTRDPASILAESTLYSPPSFSQIPIQRKQDPPASSATQVATPSFLHLKPFYPLPWSNLSRTRPWRHEGARLRHFLVNRLESLLQNRRKRKHIFRLGGNPPRVQNLKHIRIQLIKSHHRSHV